MCPTRLDVGGGEALVSASAYRTEVRRDGVVDGPVMVQEFLSEIQDGGEWSLMFFGGEFSHAVVKRPATGDFRVQVEHGGSAVARETSPELRGSRSGCSRPARARQRLPVSTWC